MKVSVFGAGYVGLVTAACLADMGNQVICIDVDADRIAGLRLGIMPIHEPGLDALVTRNHQEGRLVFTTDRDQGVAHGDLIYIAVGTPPGEDGSADLRHVLDVGHSIGRAMTGYKVIINKSTVPVGTADRVRCAVDSQLQIRGLNLPFAVVSNPEFLKEGAAIDDFMHPDRIIVGCDDDQAGQLVRSLYAPFLRNRDRLLMMDVRSAELTKYVANAMLATRISFMNEMALLAERLDADIEQVRMGIGSDRRIGTHFLYAGCGWGGSCFPKDLDALSRTAEDVGMRLGLLQATRTINTRQRQLLAERVTDRFGEDLRGRQLAVWGLAFKPGTDDMREAPSVYLINALLSRGAVIQAFDPAAMDRAAQLWAEQDGFRLCKHPMSAVQNADALIIVTEWREFRSPDFQELATRLRQPVVIDGRNLYDPATMRRLGFEYSGIGRAAPAARQPATGSSARRLQPAVAG